MTTLYSDLQTLFSTTPSTSAAGQEGAQREGDKEGGGVSTSAEVVPRPHTTPPKKTTRQRRPVLRLQDLLVDQGGVVSCGPQALSPKPTSVLRLQVLLADHRGVVELRHAGAGVAVLVQDLEVRRGGWG